MNGMRLSLKAASVLLLVPSAAWATSGSGGGSGSMLLEALMLALSVGCLVVSWKVMAFVRGGRLATPWQWLTVAFFIFALGQTTNILSGIVLPTAAEDIVVLLHTLGFLLLLLAMVKIRKVLT